MVLRTSKHGRLGSDSRREKAVLLPALSTVKEPDIHTRVSKQLLRATHLNVRHPKIGQRLREAFNLRSRIQNKEATQNIIFIKIRCTHESKKKKV